MEQPEDHQPDEATEAPSNAVETQGEHDDQVVPQDAEQQDATEQGDEDEASGQDQENFGNDMNNGFPNMNFNGTGDFNQMQMMMAMQNGMGNNAFGGFPMMSE